MTSHARSKDAHLPELAEVPPGFEPLNRGSPFIALIGQMYLKKEEDRSPVIGMRIQPQHANVVGVAHGGMLVTLADTALGITLKMASNERRMVTVNLSTDFVESARPGDWVEARVDIQKSGRRLAFANCYLTVGERRVLRASGVFAALD